MAVCLRDKSIDNNDGSVRRVKRSCGIRTDNGSVGGRRGIDDAHKVSETTTEAAVGRRRAQGIYDDDGGIGGGR